MEMRLFDDSRSTAHGGSHLQNQFTTKELYKVAAAACRKSRGNHLPQKSTTKQLSKIAAAARRKAGENRLQDQCTTKQLRKIAAASRRYNLLLISRTKWCAKFAMPDSKTRQSGQGTTPRKNCESPKRGAYTNASTNAGATISPKKDQTFSTSNEHILCCSEAYQLPEGLPKVELYNASDHIADTICILKGQRINLAWCWESRREADISSDKHAKK